MVSRCLPQQSRFSNVTHGGIELTTPVLLVCLLNHYSTGTQKNAWDFPSVIVTKRRVACVDVVFLVMNVEQFC